ncbi:MAG: ABC transporter substrate-binding protein, partial [Actinomycetota bacterium]
LERALNLNHPEGAAFLIGAIESIETPDDYTVEITLSEPNVTFLSRLAYTVATILPADHYPAPDGELGEDDDPEEYIEEELVATGPYQVTDFREGESITLEANPDYWGDPPANDRVLVQFFSESAQLKAALEAGEVDIAYRDLDPQQRADLEGNDQIQSVEGEGASIRYVVFNTFMEPFDDPEVRQAFAAAVDRQRILDEVLEGAGEPLYSMIPPGFETSEPLFQEKYEGEDPASFLSDQETPIEIELWYTTDHYGDTEPSIAQNIERALEESDVFDVQLESSEWAEFTQDAWPGEDATYPSFLLGWYPDYFDPDDYIEPFYASGGFLGFYANEEMDELIAAEQQVDDPAAAERDDVFADIQELAAEDVPLLPLYEETPFAFVREGVEGVEDTMDPVQIFRYFEISVTE